MASKEELLEAYDSQLRDLVPPNLPEGVRVEVDGPLLRFVGEPHGGFVGYRDLAGLRRAELDELIARQIRVFAERGERFEWKLHEHDEPSDLAEHLLAAGFVPGQVEALLIAPVEKIVSEPVLPDGVSLREVSEDADIEMIGELDKDVWDDEDSRTIVPRLNGEIAAAPDAITVVVAEVESRVVCAGWIRFAEGTDFASLWGGSTHPAWRRRGIYRALVAYRANLAAQRGFTYLQVDASPESRPILERLGFVLVTTTTPYIWRPPSP